MSKSYNGFSGAFRSQVGREQFALLKAGAIRRPTTCLGCGGTRAQGYAIHLHLENYYLPVEGILGACLCCHYALHKRWEDPERWHRYLAQVAEGWQPPTIQSRGGYWPFQRFWADLEPLAERPDGEGWLFDLPLVEPDLATPW